MTSTLELTPDGEQFVHDRHLATLSTIAPSGLIHVVAVGFTVAGGVLRVITSDGTQKVRNIERDPRATIGQVEGPRWLTVAGHAVIERDPDAVEHAVRLYSERYRQPGINPRRVVIRLDPAQVLGSSGLVRKG